MHPDLPEERLDGGHVRASLLNAHIAWLETYGNDEDVAAVALKLRRFPAYAPTDWIDVRTLVQVDRTIVQRFAGVAREDDLLEDIGRFTARTLLPAPFHEHSDEERHRFLRELAAFDRDLTDFNQATWRRCDAKRAHIIRTGATCFSRVLCVAAVGFYEQYLLSRSALHPIVSEETCRCLGWPWCKFVIRWR